MLKAILILTLFLFPSYLNGATFYHWVDENGTDNFTDDYQKVPSEYLNQVRVRVMEDIPETQPPILPPTARATPQKEEAKREDALGFQEERQREKELSLERQLKEDSEGYETANKAYLGESDKLIERRYGSHQQYKSTILGMSILREERNRYEAKLTEAKEWLKKISGESDSDGLANGSALQLDSSNGVRIERDIYGRNRTWWRDKVFAQGEQLKEAVENYEKAYKAYSKEIDTLGSSRFGELSLTQYQMISTRLSVLKGEMERYEAQITEVNEGLRKLVKEAEESKANLDWVIK